MRAAARARRTALLPALAALAIIATGAAPAARAAIEHDRDDTSSVVFEARIAFDATINAGEDRYALLGVTVLGTAAQVTSADLLTPAEAFPLSFVGAMNAPAGGCRLEWWGLVDPPVGAHQVVAQLGAPARYSGATLISYRGVDRAAPIGSFVSAGGRRGPSAVTVASVPGGLVLDNTCGVSPAETSVLAIAGDGQTARWHWSIASLSSAASQHEGRSSVTMTWTASGDGMLEWASGGIALNPAGGPSGDVRLRIGNAGCAAGGPALAPGALTGCWTIALTLATAWALRRREGGQKREQRRR
jgi:hypothetical protein